MRGTSSVPGKNCDWLWVVAPSSACEKMGDGRGPASLLFKDRCGSVYTEDWVAWNLDSRPSESLAVEQHCCSSVEQGASRAASGFVRN